MAYPPPPGISNHPPGTSSSNNSGSNPSHPSLPARPPVPSAASLAGNGSSVISAPGTSNTAGGFKSSFKPSFSSAHVSAQPSYSSAPSYAAGTAPAPGHYGPSSYPSYSQSHQPAPSVSGGAGGGGPPFRPRSYQQRQHQQQHGGYQHQQGGYNANHNASAYGGAGPQIRNPFPMPGAPGPTATAAGNESYEPEMAAQIAQWQSAYNSHPSGTITAGPMQDPSAGGFNSSMTGAGFPFDSTAAGAATGSNNTAIGPSGAATSSTTETTDKKKTVAREGGGKKWTDDTLLEWDPSHLRLFVGNLAGEVTDDSLFKAFSRWGSAQKARVVRDKRTSKSKGFGFVSFSDADDFFQAAKEMNGKYIQSHPVVVRKANTEIKVTNVKEKGKGGYGHGGKKKGGGHNGGKGGGNGTDAVLGPMQHGGVSKPGQKTKNGLRLLG